MVSRDVFDPSESTKVPYRKKDRYLSVAKAAELIGIGRQSAYRWIDQGSIEWTLSPHGVYLIPVDAAKDHAQRRRSINPEDLEREFNQIKGKPSTKVQVGTKYGDLRDQVDILWEAVHHLKWENDRLKAYLAEDGEGFEEELNLIDPTPDSPYQEFPERPQPSLGKA